MDKSENARIILRVPFSFIFLLVSILIAVLGEIILGEPTATDSTIIELVKCVALAAIFSIPLIFIEKESFHSGLMKIKEYLVENI